MQIFEPWRWFAQWDLAASKALRLWIYSFNPRLADTLVPSTLQMPTAPYALDYRTEVIPPGWRVP